MKKRRVGWGGQSSSSSSVLERPIGRSRFSRSPLSGKNSHPPFFFLPSPPPPPPILPFFLFESETGVEEDYFLQATASLV